MEKNQQIIGLESIAKGLGLTFFILFIGIFILAILVSIFNFSGPSIDKGLFLLNYLALFIGGFCSAYLAKNKGWLHGSGVAILYLLFVLILGGFWFSITMSVDFILRVLIAFSVSALGGMIGVNLI